ncbi:MAG: type II toxin-antitoxin system VapC family toxin [Mangrovibacterium sp.]
MNGKLIDTNILIYLSQRKINLEDITQNDSRLYISVITYMEALGYPFRNSQEKQTMEKICSIFEIIQLEQTIVDEVIRIRQKHKIKLPDAIILGTAISGKLELITANTADFINIHPGVPLHNPMK